MALHTWWLFAAAVFLASATPGPNMLHVMARSVELGLVRAMAAMAGCLLALLALLTTSALGLTALLLAIPGLFTALRFAGAAYLIYLGYKAWTAGEAPIDLGSDTAALGRTPSRIFRGGFMVGISNPKALLFVSALLPQFIDAAAPKGPQFAAMVATIAVIETAWYFVYALTGRSIAGMLERPSPRRMFNRITGGAFVVFGLAMAGARA